MKKIVTFVLLLCMVVLLVACADKENTTKEDTTPEATAPEITVPEDATPEITSQALYDSSYIPTLLDKYDSVAVVSTQNGEVFQEEYYSKEYRYINDAYNPENTYVVLSTPNSHYINYNDTCLRVVAIEPSGLADMKSVFEDEMKWNILSSSILNDTITSVTEKDGQIFVVNSSDEEERQEYADAGWTLSDEEYVLDAETLDVISISSVSTEDSGETHEIIMKVTYNGELLEGMKKFIECEQQTEDMRTLTVVSNPGAENEKTESIQLPKGLQVAFSDLVPSEEEEEEYTTKYTLYADAACTETFEEEWDTDSDVTVYVKWAE